MDAASPAVSWRRCVTRRVSCRERRCVDVLPVPQFKHEQLPQTERVIAFSAHVLRENAIDERVVEIATLACDRRSQNVAERLAQRPTEPMVHRDGKPLLRTVEDRARNECERELL